MRNNCWVIADAATGYVSAFKVYMGEKGDTVEKGLFLKCGFGIGHAPERIVQLLNSQIK